jgi:radical SAM/Cys-rich protein
VAVNKGTRIMIGSQTATKQSAEKWAEGSLVEPFSKALAGYGLELRRGETNTLQINLGLRCNQECRHCHLEAGPERSEMMSWETAQEVIGFARRGAFPVIDLTGGAPELYPRLPALLETLAPHAQRLMLRCNLTVLAEKKQGELLEVCRAKRVVLVGSLPSLNASQTEAQRGQGVFLKSLWTLKMLNEMGYGRPGSSLELNLVSNPVGAFLPGNQAQAEKRFRREIREKWKIEFHHFFTFANAPLGRFRRWLEETGNLEAYLRKLASNFNPCTLAGVMCRTLVSVGWDGYLFDCDFHLAKGIHLGGRKRHISEMTAPPQPGEPIATSDHCYACTAGSGFT